MRQNSLSSLSLSYDGSAPSLDGLGRRVSGGGGGGSGGVGGIGVGPGVAAKDFFGAQLPPAAFAPPMAARSFNNSTIFVKMASNGDRSAVAGNPTTNGGGPPSHNHQEYTLNVICSALINQDQLWRLFDIIPGLDYCQLIGESGPNANRAIVKYNNLESCTYAKDKLHGLEYPLGERLIVKMDIVTTSSSLLSVNPTAQNIRAPHQLNAVPATCDMPMDGGRDNLCSVALPPPSQLAYAGSVCAQRCFLVCVSQVTYCRSSDQFNHILMNVPVSDTAHSNTAERLQPVRELDRHLFVAEQELRICQVCDRGELSDCHRYASWCGDMWSADACHGGGGVVLGTEAMSQGRISGRE